MINNLLNNQKGYVMKKGDTVRYTDIDTYDD